MYKLSLEKQSKLGTPFGCRFSARIMIMSVMMKGASGPQII